MVTNANKIYRIAWSAVKDDVTTLNYELKMYRSDETSYIPSLSMTTINLAKECLRNIELTYEYDTFPIGLQSAPVLKLTFDVNATDNSITGFNDILKNPYRIGLGFCMPPNLEYYATSDDNFPNIEVSTIFELFINDELVFVGLQKGSDDDGYDSDNYEFNVEAIHISRIIAENMKMSFLNIMWGLVSDSNYYIKESQVAYDFILSDPDYPGLDDDNVIAYGATSAKIGDGFTYFYYIKFSEIANVLNTIYDSLLYTLTRGLYPADSEIHLPIPFEYIFYKQDYTNAFGRGNEIGQQFLYILGYIANKPLSERNSAGFKIFETWVTKLEDYKTLWDFLTVYSLQNFVRYNAKQYYFDYTQQWDVINSVIENKDIIEKPKITLNAEVLKEVTWSLVETYDDDTTSKAISFPASRAENSKSIPILFNNNYSHRKSVGDGSVHYTASIYEVGWNEYFNLFKIGDIGANKIGIVRHFKPSFLKFYYFDNPVYEARLLTIEEVPVGVCHDCNIILGNSITSDDINPDWDLSLWTNKWEYPTGSQLFWGEQFSPLMQYFIKDIQLNSCLHNKVARAFLQSYRGKNKKQVFIENLKVDILTTSTSYMFLDFIKGIPPIIEYDINLLSPPNDPNFLDNISNTIYVTSLTVNLLGKDKTTEIFELKGMTRSYE